MLSWQSLFYGQKWVPALRGRGIKKKNLLSPNPPIIGDFAKAKQSNISISIYIYIYIFSLSRRFTFQRQTPINFLSDSQLLSLWFSVCFICGSGVGSLEFFIFVFFWEIDLLADWLELLWGVFFFPEMSLMCEVFDIGEAKVEGEWEKER